MPFNFSHEEELTVILETKHVKEYALLICCHLLSFKNFKNWNSLIL